MESKITLEDIKNLSEVYKMDKKYLDIIVENKFWLWSVDNLQKLLEIFEDEYWHKVRLYDEELECVKKIFLVLKKVKCRDELSAEQKEELNVLLAECEAKNDFCLECDDATYNLRKVVEFLIDCQTEK